MRYFNTTGPCDPRWHYMVPSEPRLPEARPLVERGQYFVVHAPRQTGKTTALRDLARVLTAEGEFAALHFSCEAGEPMGEDVGAVEDVVLSEMNLSALHALSDELRPPQPWPAAPAGQRLRVGMAHWASTSPRRLVLFFDEIDALRGESMRAVLRQLRAGFPSRPDTAPWSVALCGLRDVRDYKAASGGDPTRLGTSSPFNVKVESLRLDDFEPAEARMLFDQHAAETGQPLAPDSFDKVWALTRGQPWLTNALAREVVEKIRVEPPEPITSEHLDEAKERLILARQTHLDSLVARLNEPRVRRVLGPLIAGAAPGSAEYDDDASYVRDLGLIAQTKPAEVSNPIYREVIVRVLSSAAEDNVVIDPRRFVRSDGTLDLRLLLDEFRSFWIEHGEIVAGNLPYHEVAPQLVLMAFMQRVINGGGYIDREYGVGRGRIDLLLRWPHERDGKRLWQRDALELKVWADGRPDPLDKGLEQLDAYLERLGLDAGVLVVFDRRSAAAPIAERTIFEDATTPSGRTVTVLRA